MKNNSPGVLCSIPYEIAVVRPLRQTTLRERENALKAAYYNTELVPQEMVYVDLKTDSGVSSLSTAQLSKLTGVAPLESGMEMAPEGNRAFVCLSEKFREIFASPSLVPSRKAGLRSASGQSCTSKTAPWWRATCFSLRPAFTS